MYNPPPALCYAIVIRQDSRGNDYGYAKHVNLMLCVFRLNFLIDGPQSPFAILYKLASALLAGRREVFPHLRGI